MMHWYTVEFRIEGTTLRPSEVTTALALRPSQVREAGARVGTKVFERSLWAFDAAQPPGEPVEWESLELGLSHLLAALQPKRELLQSRFGTFEMYWWCGHFQQSFNGGPTFSVDMLRKLAEFGAPVVLENYFSDAD